MAISEPGNGGARWRRRDRQPAAEPPTDDGEKVDWKPSISSRLDAGYTTEGLCEEQEWLEVKSEEDVLQEEQRPESSQEQSEQRPAEKKTLQAGQTHLPQDPCPVCLEGFDASSGMPRTCRKCKNSFHQACLAEWAKKEQQIKWEQKPWMLPSQFDSGSCPCCRSSKGHDKSRRWKK